MWKHDVSYDPRGKQHWQATYSLDDFISVDPACRELKESVRKCAVTSSPVLITGESGTGKEIIAHAIHKLSGRHNGPFVAVNCAAIPNELIEAELFGYEPGAFTGAGARGGTGKVEFAHGGTLFLDEIAEMRLDLQAKLLRLL